jgi:hypothetical protein
LYQRKNASPARSKPLRGRRFEVVEIGMLLRVGRLLKVERLLRVGRWPLADSDLE